MTEPEGDSQAISVAELLARNGQRVGAGGGGRRRRGVKGGISVAELTGEFPAVRNGRTAGESDDDPETPAAAQIPAPEVPAKATAAPEPVKAAETPVPARPEAPAAPKAARIAPAPTTPRAPKAPEAPKAPARPAATAKAPAPAPESDATAVFTLADADAQDKRDARADAKASANSAAKGAAAKADDAPTVVAPAVKDDGPTGRGTNAGWRSVASTTVGASGPAPARGGAPEPRLLSGQTLAGDLMRQGNERAAAETDGDVDSDADLDNDENLGDFGDFGDLEDLDDEPEASGAKQWAVLLGQGAVAVVAGALMFKGFEKLWDMLPMVALVLAVLVIVGLVAMVRILRRTDDITSLVIAVVAGVFVTLGPLAFLLGTS
ncbi:hypothetical protein [Rhodococcus sp. BE178]|uniref:hypothetical protein n=1 Tax=Rhodococcus sp. BE178 TaxID=2817737 RepID=UPI003D1A8AE4